MMSEIFSIRKRIFIGLALVALISVIAFASAIKISSDVIESVILESTFEDEFVSIQSALEQKNIWLPNSSHTSGFLASQENIPIEFISYEEGQFHEVEWKNHTYHLFVKNFSHPLYKNDTLYLAINIDAIERYEERLNIILLISSVSLLVCLFWLILWFSSIISKPVMDLSKHVNMLSEKDTQLPKTLDTDLKPIEEAINSYLCRIQNHLKKEKMFSGVASHELRTPISTIRSSLETFLNNSKDNIEPKQLTRIQRALRATIEMQYLTESLLYLVKSDQPTKAEEESVSLNTLVENIIDEHKPLIRNDNVKIEITCKQELTLNQNITLAKVLIGNLVRNALEQTHTGTVRLLLCVNSFEIQNPGEPLNPDIIDWINLNHFDYVEQKNIGIGLFLVSKICQQLNWEIKAGTLKKSSGTSIKIIWGNHESRQSS